MDIEVLYICYVDNGSVVLVECCTRTCFPGVPSGGGDPPMEPWLSVLSVNQMIICSKLGLTWNHLYISILSYLH